MSINLQICKEEVTWSTSPEYIEFIPFGHSEFNLLWSKFLEDYPIFSHVYHLVTLEYHKLLSDPSAFDISFIVKNKQNGQPLAICPLIIEQIDGKIQGSYGGGGFLPVPLLHAKLGIKQRRSLEKSVFEHACSVLGNNSASRWFVETEILNVGTDLIEDNLLARFGGLEVSIQSHIMDLTVPDDVFWQQIRHSAKSTINQGLQKYQFKVYDKLNYTEEVGTRHRLLHHKCAGRITRPIPTFYKMYSLIENDCGLMFEQTFNGEVVQMIMVALGKYTAVGASAADDPDFDPPVALTHSMNFFIYQEVKRRGIKYYEVGETSFRHSMHCMMTPKEKKICDFKRSFGRNSYPLKRWIWFSNPEEEIDYLETQLKKYKDYLRDSANQRKVGTE